MDVVQLYHEFVKSHGQVLYSIEQSLLHAGRKASSDTAVLAKKNAFMAQSIRSQFEGRYRDGESRLITLLETVDDQDDSILKAAEYLTVGTAKIPGVEKLSDIPYIVPFLGHSPLFLEGNDEEADRFCQTLILSALKQTAAGQLTVDIFNPEWRESYSCFTALDGCNVISSAEQLDHLLDLLSRQVSQADGMLQGRFPSMLAMRCEAKQPVGQLRLVVVADDDWVKEDNLCSRVLRMIAGGVRAGIGFIIRIPSDDTVKKHPVRNAVIFQKAGRGVWKTNVMPDVILKPCLWEQKRILPFFSELKETAEKSVAVSVPFDSIENTSDMWLESSSGGITFSLGRSGLKTVTLRMGDEISQLNNILITGAPGKGKSNLIEVMIHSLCCRYSPDELELYLLDFKDGLTFKPYGDIRSRSWLPHAAVLGLESARDFGVAVLRHIENERVQRAITLKRASAHSVAQYRELHPNERMPRIVIMIDEYQKLLEINDETGEQAAVLIENIVRQGRACGIHLVLASQTVAHGGALVGEKADSIYASIPIRIALQNNLQESYATFVQGNDAAAQLRVRGEAVLNVNYGALDSNVKFTVAYAERKRMQELRSEWCSRPLGKAHRPKSFGASDFFAVRDAVETIRGWRRVVESSGFSPRVLCGQALSVEREIVGVPFGSDAGRNILIVGNGDGEEEMPGVLPLNYAVGLMQGMALSLAAQHPEGDAAFTVIDGLADVVKKRNSIPRWLSQMERMGFPVSVVTAREAPSFFARMVSNLQTHDCGCHYIFAMGMDRCTNLADEFTIEVYEDQDTGSSYGEQGAGTFAGIQLDPSVFSSGGPGASPSAEGRGSSGDSTSPSPKRVKTTGSEQLELLLNKGPTNGVHLIGWWSSYHTYETHVAFKGRGFIDIALLLRTGLDVSRSILGTHSRWEGEPNRVLLHDPATLRDDVVLMPMMSLRTADAGVMEVM